MHRALRLAEIESEEGVNSTFFILLRCEFYSIFEKAIKERVHKILSLGNEVALHFDITYYPEHSLKKNLKNHLEYEASILENEFGAEIKSFSFHNTTELTKKFTDPTYGRLLNTGSDFFMDKYSYCSDSNGYWKFKRLNDVLERDDIQYLQVLTHPVWWVKSPMLPRERVLRATEGRAKDVVKAYDLLLDNHGKVNVGKKSKD